MKLLAQNEYQVKVLAPLPGTTINNNNQTADLRSYLPGMFILIIGLTAVLAVGWIIWGGVEYITTDSWTGKEEGKNRIKNALIGLVIVIMSWLILNAINPDLLDINLNIATTEVKAPNVPIATAGCADCVPIQNIATKNGANITVNPATATNLNNLSTSLKTDSNIVLQINEGYSQDAIHTSTSCHHTGSCVDANVISGPGSLASNVATIVKAGPKSNMAVTYELVGDPNNPSAAVIADKKRLTDAGVPAKNIVINGEALGNHLHIIDCTTNQARCALYN